MDATVSLRKFTADSNEFIYIKIKTRQVKGDKKLVPLQDGQMLQMFLQFEGEHEYHENEKLDKERGYTKWIEDDEAQHYENYVGTIYYRKNDNETAAIVAEVGDADGEEEVAVDTSVQEESFYSSASCGWEKLDSQDIEGWTFMGVEGKISGCGFYQQKLYDMSVINTEDEVSYTMAFERQFNELNVTPLKRGDTLKMHAGFKIFDSFKDRDSSVSSTKGE